MHLYLIFIKYLCIIIPVVTNANPLYGPFLSVEPKTLAIFRIIGLTSDTDISVIK